MFTVKIDDIPEEGLTVSWDEQRDSLLEYLKQLSSIDFDFESPLHVEVRLDRVGDSYLIRGSLQTVLRLQCVRCLKEFGHPLSTTFDLSLHPTNNAPSDEEVELGEEDMKSNFFEGGELRLSEIACEQIFLEIPYQPLCTKECKGLCPRCGRDLNLSSCECPKEELNGGFAALRKFKIDPS